MAGAVTIMGASAFAAFSTTATATGNTFSTTTPTLTISTDGGSTFSTSKPGFTVGGLVPGGTTADQPFKLQNINTDPDGDLNVTVHFVNLSGGLNGDKITFTVDCGLGPQAVATYNVLLGAAQNLGTINNFTTADCIMKATLSSAADNNDAGQNRVFDAVFTGTVVEPSS